MWCRLRELRMSVAGCDDVLCVFCVDEVLCGLVDVRGVCC